MWAGAQAVLTAFVNNLEAVALDFNVQENRVGRVGGGDYVRELIGGMRRGWR